MSHVRNHASILRGMSYRLSVLKFLLEISHVLMNPGSQGGQKYRTHNKQKEANSTGHILGRNCTLKHIIVGKV